MAIILNDNLQINAPKAIDARVQHYTIASRNAIDPNSRWAGMQVYVEDAGSGISEWQYLNLTSEDDLSVNDSWEPLASAPESTVTNAKYIIYGGAEWSGTGLVFNTSEIQYNYYGTVGIISPDSVTLDSGDAEDRFDIIAVKQDTNSIAVLKGIPSDNPLFPEIPEEYIPIQPVLVKTGATTPDITQIAVYQENEEWVTSTLGTLTGTVDFEATDTPIIGSKYVKVAACNRNTIVVFTSNTGNVLYADAQLLTLKIRVTSVIPSNANLVLRNRFNGNNSGTAVSLNSLGFNPTLINSVQSIVIPTSYFNAAQGNGLSLQLIHGSVNLNMSWDLDNILFSIGQAPVPQPEPPSGDVIQSIIITTANTTVNLENGNIIYVNAQSNSEIDVSNIVVGKKYTFIFSTLPPIPRTITFNTDRFHADGGFAPVELTTGYAAKEVVVVECIGLTATALALRARSDVEGGGSTYTAGKYIDIENNVIAVDIQGDGDEEGWVEVLDGLSTNITDLKSGGSTWIAISTNGSNTQALMRSMDNGLTWVAQLHSTNLSCVGTNGNRVWVIGLLYNKLSRSTDDGVTWEEVYTNTDGTVQFYSIDCNNEVFIAASASYILRSGDSGATWTKVHLSGGINMTYLGNDTWICAGNISTDNGETWSVSTLSLPDSEYAASASNRDGIAIVQSGLDIARTSDYGATWSYQTADSGVSYGRIAQYGNTWRSVDFDSNTQLLSVDNGLTWADESSAYPSSGAIWAGLDGVWVAGLSGFHRFESEVNLITSNGLNKFTRPQKGVPAIEFDDLVTKSQLDTRILDAPSDNKVYARKNNAWEEVVPGGGGLGIIAIVDCTEYGGFWGSTIVKGASEVSTTDDTYGVTINNLGGGNLMGWVVCTVLSNGVPIPYLSANGTGLALSIAAECEGTFRVFIIRE